MSESTFSQLSRRKKLAARKAAYRQWLLVTETEKRPKSVYKRIAKENGMTIDELYHFMERDKWEQRAEKDRKKMVEEEINANLKDNVNLDPSKTEAINDINKLLHESDIPDRWKIFIMYYLHSYNITYAAKHAGYTDARNCSAGFKALQDERVKKLIREIKDIMYTEIYVTGQDILNEYVRIAFADITEFVSFNGQTVDLKDSKDIDGRLITEVKSGREGVTIKLADKMKAMEKLEKLFEVIPDRKLQLEREKFEFQKELANKADGNGDTKTVIVNDIG